jgi:hypothetical protein
MRPVGFPTQRCRYPFLDGRLESQLAEPRCCSASRTFDQDGLRERHHLSTSRINTDSARLKLRLVKCSDDRPACARRSSINRNAERYSSTPRTRPIPFYADCSRSHVVAAAEASLQCLGTDYLDILLLHWPDLLVRPDEVAATFDDLERDGKVRHFGVSNHASPANRSPAKNGSSAAGRESDLIGPGERSFVGGLLGRAVARRALRVHRTLGDDRLLPTPRYSITGVLTRCDASAMPGPRCLLQASQVVFDLALRKSTSPAAIAMAWLLHHPAEILPIFGATNPEHVAQNCAAADVVLTNIEGTSYLHRWAKRRRARANRRRG